MIQTDITQIVTYHTQIFLVQKKPDSLKTKRNLDFDGRTFKHFWLV